MTGITHVIHEPQRAVREKALLRVVLQHDAVLRHARGFAEHDGGVLGVMQDVDEEDAIERGVREGELVAIELRHGDGGLRPHQHVHPLRGDIWLQFAEEFGERAVATADIEQARVRGDERGDVLAQHPDAPAENKFSVNGIDGVHP